MGETVHLKTIRNIKDDYRRLEHEIVNRLYVKVPHGTTVGQFREMVWEEMFRNIIPRKFVIEQSVFIIDSQGKVSKEVDLAIFDEMYTPYIFKYQGLKFIPIEAVAVVVECKSSSMKPSHLKKWAESIAELKTSQKSYVRIVDRITIGEKGGVPTQSATRPLRILCCLNNKKKINDLIDEGNSFFDMVIRADDKMKSLEIKLDANKKNLYEWYRTLNHVGNECGTSQKEKMKGQEVVENIGMEKYQISDKKGQLSLLTLNFQLNQLLMLINNPMMFPHTSYVKMFNEIEEEEAIKDE